MRGFDWPDLSCIYCCVTNYSKILKQIFITSQGLWQESGCGLAGVMLVLEGAVKPSARIAVTHEGSTGGRWDLCPCSPTWPLAASVPQQRASS